VDIFDQLDDGAKPAPAQDIFDTLTTQKPPAQKPATDIFDEVAPPTPPPAPIAAPKVVASPKSAPLPPIDFSNVDATKGSESGGFGEITGNEWQAKQLAKFTKPADAVLAKLAPKVETPEQKGQLEKAVADINASKLETPGTAKQALTAAFSPPKPFTDLVEIGRGIQQDNRDTVLAMRNLAAKHGIDPDKAAKLPSLAEQYMRGGANALLDTALSFTSPGGLVTLGFGSLPKAVQKSASVGFSAQMLSQFPDAAQQLLDEESKPDSEKDHVKIAQLYLGAMGDAGFGILAGTHGLLPSVPETITPQKGVPNASQITSPESVLESQVRPQVGEETRIRQQGQAAEARPEKTQVVPSPVEAQSVLTPPPAPEPVVSPTTKPVDVIQKVLAIPPKDLMASFPMGENNLTGSAYRLGRNLTSPDELTALQDAQTETKARVDKFRKDGDLNNAMIEAARHQFFNEAYQAATGTGSARLALAKDPNYKPPFPVPAEKQSAVSVAQPEKTPVASDIELARQTLEKEGKLTVSLVQRRNKLGYVKSAAAVDALAANGEIVKQPDGTWVKSPPREIIEPSQDTQVGENAAGEKLYERKDGSRYRIQGGKPNFGGDLAPKPAVEKAAPVAAELKVGDPIKLMGVDSVLADTHTEDGMKYEIFNGAALGEKRAAIRATNLDTGNITTLKQYPDYDAAMKDWNGVVKREKTWEETARGRSVYKSNLATENAKDEKVVAAMKAAPSYPKLKAAYDRFRRSLYGKSYNPTVIETKPWDMLDSSSGVMNAKSAMAKTLRELESKVFAESGLPRKKPDSKFRGGTGVDWDKVQVEKPKPAESAAVPNHIQIRQEGQRQFEFDNKYAKLMKAGKGEKDAAANEFSPEDAKTALARLEAAPGFDAEAKASLERRIGGVSETPKLAVENGYESPKAFADDFAKNRDAEVNETEEEFLNRRHCMGTIPSRKSMLNE